MTSATPPRVIDVRTPGEFETAHIAGSYNVPLDLLREHRDEIVKHLDQQVVLVCRSGQRAGQAEVTLREAGLCNVHILDGGITSWEAKGFAVTRGAQRWDLERQVRLVAGSIVLTSVLGSIAVPKLKWVAGAIGGGLTFAALSNTCAMGMMLAKLPYNRGTACDAQSVVAQLVAAVIALTVGLAVFVGVALGLLGGGGSILTVPLLAYVGGMDAKQAIATSLLVVGVTSVVGAISHARAGRVQWRTGLIFGGAGMVGAYAGGVLARFIPGTVLLIGFAVMMIATAVAMLRGRRTVDASGTGHRLPVPKIVAEGLVVGLVTGLVGAGGGFLVVPALALLGGLPMPIAVGDLADRDRDEVVRRPGRLPVQRPDQLDRGAGGDRGGRGRRLIGARLTAKVDPDSLRKAFGWFVLAMSSVILAQEIHPAVGIAAAALTAVAAVHDRGLHPLRALPPAPARRRARHAGR